MVKPRPAVSATFCRWWGYYTDVLTPSLFDTILCDMCLIFFSLNRRRGVARIRMKTSPYRVERMCGRYLFWIVPPVRRLKVFWWGQFVTSLPPLAVACLPLPIFRILLSVIRYATAVFSFSFSFSLPSSCCKPGSFSPPPDRPSIAWSLSACCGAFERDQRHNGDFWFTHV